MSLEKEEEEERTHDDGFNYIGTKPDSGSLDVPPL